MHVAARMKCRLKVDAANGWMFDSEVDDLANLVIVHSTFNGRNERDIEPDRCQAIQGQQLLLKNVGLTANDAIGLTIIAVELEVNRRANPGELFEEAVIVCDAFAVRVDHDKRDATGTCCLHKVDDLRMNRGFAS